MPPAFILSQDQTLLFLITPSSRRNFLCLILAQIDVIVYISSLILFFYLILFSFQKSFLPITLFHRRLYIISFNVFIVNMFFNFFNFFYFVFLFSKVPP